MNKRLNNKVSEEEWNEVYYAMGALMKVSAWNFINDILLDATLKVWRTELDILMIYASATLPAKDKLKARPRFIDRCKKFHPNPRLWKGLD